LPGAILTGAIIQVLRSPILALLLHGTQLVGVSQTLWCGTRNGIKELLYTVFHKKLDPLSKKRYDEITKGPVFS